MDKALNYLGLAKKARLIELGEEPVGAAARANKARLVVVASDATDHTDRRAKSFVSGTDQICIRIPYSKEELGEAIGRQSLAIAAITDPALALAFVKALGNPEKYTDVLENLDKRTQRIRQHQAEEKAHQRNKAMGRTRKARGKKEV